MALVVFESTVNMLTVATPSIGGHILAFDSDGVLKQKNDQGVITAIAGSTPVGSLEQTLSVGNTSGTYSINLGANSKISSVIGGGQLRLDNGIGGANIVNLSTDYGTLSQSYLFMNSNSLTLRSLNASLLFSATSAIFQLNSSNVSSFSSNNYYVTLNGLRVIDFTTATSSTTVGNRVSALISTNNSKLNTGVYNTVVLGGTGITGATSNSVYVPNLYVQDGGFIKGTNGLGQLVFNSDDEVYTRTDNKIIGILSSTSSFCQYLTSTDLMGIVLADTHQEIQIPSPGGYLNDVTFISAYGAISATGIQNTVVIGGTFIEATQSSTTYIGGTVDINNQYKLPTSDGVSGQVIQTDGIGNTFWGYGSSVIEITAASFSTLNGVFLPSITYKILDADTSLYGGTEIYLTTNASGVLDETGVGKFYNPLYDQLVSGFGIWSPTGTYYVNNTVFWGGKAWINTTGNTSTSIDIFTLNTDDWNTIPFDDTYYSSYYVIVYDEIKYDWQNDLIIYRNEKNSNIVSVNKSVIDHLINSEYPALCNPIKAFQWGNLYDDATNIGIGRQNITNSYNENINFAGTRQVDLLFTNYSKQYNCSFINGSYQENIIMENFSWDRNGNNITNYETNLTYVTNKHLFGNDFLIKEALSNVNIKGTLNYTLATASGRFNASGEAVYYGTAPYGLTAGYLYANIGGTWSDADNRNNYFYQLGIALGATPSIDGMLIKGFVYAPFDMYVSTTVGSPQYISNTLGKFREGVPTSDYIRVIGHMAQNKILHFNPDNIWLKKTNFDL